MTDSNKQGTQAPEGTIKPIDVKFTCLEALQDRDDVDFVDFGDIKLFMFKHDNLYERFIPDSRKSQSVRRYLTDAKNHGFPKPSAGMSLNSLLYHVVDHLAGGADGITVLDVGCHAGCFGLRLANQMRFENINGQAILFDIGLIHELVPKNILVNDLEGIVRFEKLAVSGTSGPVTVYHDPGHSDGDNICHRNSDNSISYPADAVRLSEYIRDTEIGGNLIIKIDTEGLEPLIIKDIKEILEKHKTILVFEFTPSQFDRPVSATDFIKEMLKDFLLFDIFYAVCPTRLIEINAENPANFVTYVENTEYAYTDVLCIPRKLDGLDHLRVRLDSLHRLQDTYRLVMDSLDTSPAPPLERSYLDKMSEFLSSGHISPHYNRFLQASGLPLPDTIATLEAVLFVDQNNPKASQSLREALKPAVIGAMELGKWDAALLLLGRFPDESLTDGEWHFLKAQCLHALKADLEAALHSYNLALDFDYFEPGVRLNRGILFHQMEKHEEALTDLELAIPHFSDEVTKDTRDILKDIYLGKARGFIKQQDFEAAGDIMQKALLLAPDDPKLISEHAGILSQLEDYTGAQREFVKAAALDPDNPAVHLGLAGALFELGRTKNAESCLGHVLRLDPFNENAVKLLNNIHNFHRNGNSGAGPASRPSRQASGGGVGAETAHMPKVSIVTPSFNCERFIRNCIESVLAQDYPNFEHIIMDGASKDGTVEILKEYPHLNWVSEPDRGECQALNKALGMATGDIIGWLNADDLYEKEILPKVVEEMTSFGGADLVYGKALFVDENNIPTHWVMPTAPINLIALTRWYNLNLFQPSIFFSKRLFETVGSFREDLQYGIDYEYWFRIASRGFQFRYMDHVLSRAMIYRSSGKTATPYAVKAKEWLEICYYYQRYLTYGERLHFWKDYFIFRLRNANTLYKGVPLTLPDRIEAFIGLLMAEKEVLGMIPDNFHQRIASSSMPDKADALGLLAEALLNAGNNADSAKAFEWALDLNSSELTTGIS